MTLRIGICAPSSKVPPIEFQLGVEKIRQAGFEVQVHSQSRKGHWYFAGTDEERARAFFEIAMDPKISVIWCARGGYGAARLLPLLEKWEKKKGVPPRKLLLGYSDVTALHDFVRTRWNWSTLHAPMPGLRKFCAMPPEEWGHLLARIRGEKMSVPFGTKKLKWRGKNKPKRDIQGQLVGGNLSVLTSLVGTPYFPELNGKILFLEDVDEWLYRVDRMAEQLWMSGGLSGVKAIVLGNFLHCRDSVPEVLKKKVGWKDLERPKPSQLTPLRAILSPEKVIPGIFERIANELGIPLAVGLPCGHGPERHPLALGAEVRLTPAGRFEVVDWDWERQGGSETSSSVCTLADI